MVLNDLLAIIEKRAKEHLGTEKGFEFSKALTTDVIHFLTTGKILESDAVTMPFGKFEGMSLDHVPESYLYWLLGQDFVETSYPDLLDEVKYTIILLKNEKEHKSLMKKIK